LSIILSDIDPIEFILNDQQSIDTNSQSMNQSLIKQYYSRLSIMYCMLPDYFGFSMNQDSLDNTLASLSSLSMANSSAISSISFKQLNLETLALKWMDTSYEIREAAQALLKNELKRLGPNGRASLIKVWEPQLTSLLKDFEELNKLNLQTNQQQQQPSGGSSSTNLQVPYSMSSASSSSLSLSNSQMSLNDNQSLNNSVTSGTGSTSNQQQQSASPTKENQNNTNQRSRIKRKQFVSMILLSLIGAEFGQDVNSNSSGNTTNQAIPQGFSMEDHSILKRISLSFKNSKKNVLL
jgi:hypothetical protein